MAARLILGGLGWTGMFNGSLKCFAHLLGSPPITWIVLPSLFFNENSHLLYSPISSLLILYGVFMLLVVPCVSVLYAKLSLGCLCTASDFSVGFWTVFSDLTLATFVCLLFTVANFCYLSWISCIVSSDIYSFCWHTLEPITCSQVNMSFPVTFCQWFSMSQSSSRDSFTTLELGIYFLRDSWIFSLISGSVSMKVSTSFVFVFSLIQCFFNFSFILAVS